MSSKRLLSVKIDSIEKRAYRWCLPVGGLMLLGLSGCASTANLSVPSVNLPKFSIPENTASFKRRFYAGVNLGPTQLDPSTGSIQTSYTGNQSSTGSQIRIGYDLHNLLSLEMDSSVLGAADLNQSGTAQVKYSSLSTSAVVYGLTNVNRRSRRSGWSAFGRLGLGYNRHSSNVSALDESGADVIYGLGAEYGFSNGLAVRLEGTQYGSDARFTGLGLVYRIGNIKRYIPRNFVKAESKSEEPTLAAAHAAPKVVVYDATESIPSGVSRSRPAKVRLLASANDLDADGVHNNFDKCVDTSPRTSVDIHGCGLFDGTLEGVTFSSGSAGLNADSKSVLDNFALKLQAFPEVRVRIVGHTDNRGPADINRQVALSRATAIQTYLKRKNVPAVQLETAAGDIGNTVADNSDEQQRRKNRRIEIVTLPNLTLEEYRKSHQEIASTEKRSNRSSASDKNQSNLMAKSKNAKREVPIDDEPLEPELAAAKLAVDILPESVKVPGLEVAGILERVNFRLGTADLSEQSIPVIDELAAELKQHPSVRIAIVAHTNSRSTARENFDLTMRQAKAVTRELARRGVNRRRMKALGVGDTLPLIQNLSSAHKAINRRVELRLLGE